MEHNDDLAKAVVGKIRAGGHFLYHRTGGHTGRRRILRILAQQPEILQKDLQERLNIQAGSLSEVVIKLEAEGLIQKVRSHEDGRKWALTLTEAGQSEAQRLKEEYAAQAQALMSCFTEEELEDLYHKLDKMLNHWNAIKPCAKAREGL